MFVLLSNGLQQVSVILRTIWTKFGAEPQLRAPFLAAGRGVSHDRFDADLLESFSHFFHLAGAPFAVYDHAADHVVRETFPADAGKAFGQRCEDAVVRIVQGPARPAFQP